VVLAIHFKNRDSSLAVDLLAWRMSHDTFTLSANIHSSLSDTWFNHIPQFITKHTPQFVIKHTLRHQAQVAYKVHHQIHYGSPANMHGSLNTHGSASNTHGPPSNSHSSLSNTLVSIQNTQTVHRPLVQCLLEFPLKFVTNSGCSFGRQI